MPTDRHIYISAIGEDSHRFMSTGDQNDDARPLMLGGMLFDEGPALCGNSDADVVLHALVNAISGLSGERILGEVADRMCQKGITDSRAYVERALTTLKNIELLHLSFSIEAQHPHFSHAIDAMRANIAEMTGLPIQHVAITATSGEGLTAFGRGEGIACRCLASARVATY